MGLVGRKIDMIDPDVGRELDTNSVDRGQTFLNFEVSDDDILLPQNPQTDTNQSCFGTLVGRIRDCKLFCDLLAPPLPTIDLFDPTATASLPVIVPVTTTILAMSSATADLSAASDETVVVAPPLPPLVLFSTN